MKILIISGNYPTTQTPEVGTFVYKLVQEFCSLGNQVTVISAQKFKLRKIKNSSNYGKEKARVFRPVYTSFSNISMFFLNSYFFTKFFNALAIRTTVRKNKIDSDVIYCHFISSFLVYHQAFPKCAKDKFVAVGEYKNIDIIKSYYGKDYYENALSAVKGFIAVSPQVRLKLIEIGVPEHKIIVEPNATDLSKFKPLDKIALRTKHGFILSDKIVIFVGRFISNKGPLRVLDAVNLLDSDVKAIFIGKGPQQLVGDKILFQGSVSHHEIPEMMSLADVFVMPSEHEGSSNVIVEAMACGLPIVSSKIPEIEVQCKPTFSLLVDPLDINQIKDAIYEVCSNEELRSSMSDFALKEAQKYSLTERAIRILSFIKKND